jgi:DNA-directed RNA polymerase subunit F
MDFITLVLAKKHTDETFEKLVGEDTDKSIRDIMDEIVFSEDFLEKLVETLPKAEEEFL